ncbi:iqgap- protein [Entomophthora muscae]|uniref:Iqgap- protein n=1 Tax=Entomophthora muscae TaxID=34485 RepID=A0ACC2SMK8_9FUNG|nr:iqgap- protein [Entomophthora muscae]
MEGTASIKILGRSNHRSTRDSPSGSIKSHSAHTIGRHSKSKSVRGKTITIIPSHVATLTTNNSAIHLIKNGISDFELLPGSRFKQHSADDHVGSIFSEGKESFLSFQSSTSSSGQLQLSHITYSKPTPGQLLPSPKLQNASFKELRKRKSRRSKPIKRSPSLGSLSLENSPPKPNALALATPSRLSKLRPMPSFDPPTINSTAKLDKNRRLSRLAPERSRAGSINFDRWDKIKLSSFEKVSGGLLKSVTSRSSNKKEKSPDSDFALHIPTSNNSSTADEATQIKDISEEISGDALSPLEDASDEDSEAETFSPITVEEESSVFSTYNGTYDPDESIQQEEHGFYSNDGIFSPTSECSEFEFEWENYEAFVVMAQSYVRGTQQRHRFKQLKSQLRQFQGEVIELQAMARGCLARIYTMDPIYELRAARDLIDVGKVELIQAVARKVLTRHRFIPRVLEARAQADDFFAHLYRIQALARRVLVQRKWTNCLTTLQDCREEIFAVQAMVRGFLVRQHYRECFILPTPASPPLLSQGHRHFGNIIKFQEDYWANRTRLHPMAPTVSDMGELPVTAMKNFIHLLDDSDKDFSEELELAEGRQVAVTKIREISQTEKALNALDIKIALLVRNRISLEEVLRLARAGGVNSSALDRPHVVALKNLDKENRRRLEGYQQLFYLLQTQPQYLARLLSLMNQPGGRVTGADGTPTESKRFFETVVLTLFGFAHGAREEYMLLRLFRTAIHQELEDIGRIEEFLRGNPVFIKLAVHYNRGAKERLYLRELLQPIINAILDDPCIDLQSNPLLIYRALIKQEESRTGERSMRPYDVTAEVALGDAETRTVLIRHLQQLRAITDQFIEGIYSSLDRMPYGIRYIAKELKASLLRKFPAEREGVIVRIVGHLVYYRYINPAIVAPESFGVVEKDISPHHRRCLAEVAKMLNQVSMGKLFSDDNIFLQPLNTYVAYTSEKFARYVDAVAEVGEPEAHFGTDSLLDLTVMGPKPVIYISPTEIYSMHALLADRCEMLAPDPEDPLAILLDELGPPPFVPSDQVASNSREISLHLVNRFPAINERDAELKHLFVETKRLITYVIRVQSGASLLDILIKPSGPQEESRFDAIVNKELLVPSQNDNDNQEFPRPPPKLIDISNMSFSQLKSLALENAQELEARGWLDSEDGYQKLLNSIAADIRTKTKRRQQRSEELSRIHQTLENLEDKAAYLDDQRRTYANYLESCMLQQTASKGRRSKPIPFTKQYFHLKELEKKGEMPKFGSFRYTADKLHQKGVLVSINEYGPKQFDKIKITLSSDLPGQFKVVATYLGARLPGSDAIITLEELLQYQFDNIQVISLFNGDVRVNVNLLVYLINKKFYG